MTRVLVARSGKALDISGMCQGVRCNLAIPPLRTASISLLGPPERCRSPDSCSQHSAPLCQVCLFMMYFTLALASSPRSTPSLSLASIVVLPVSLSTISLSPVFLSASARRKVPDGSVPSTGRRTRRSQGQERMLGVAIEFQASSADFGMLAAIQKQKGDEIFSILTGVRSPGCPADLRSAEPAPGCARAARNTL